MFHRLGPPPNVRTFYQSDIQGKFSRVTIYSIDSLKDLMFPLERLREDYILSAVTPICSE